VSAFGSRVTYRAHAQVASRCPGLADEHARASGDIREHWRRRCSSPQPLSSRDTRQSVGRGRYSLCGTPLAHRWPGRCCSQAVSHLAGQIWATQPPHGSHRPRRPLGAGRHAECVLDAVRAENSVRRLSLEYSPVFGELTHAASKASASSARPLIWFHARARLPDHVQFGKGHSTRAER
jgi:hypothetical protein